MLHIASIIVAVCVLLLFSPNALKKHDILSHYINDSGTS